MPLPPALMKKLANRGLVESSKKQIESIAEKQTENEEIIAEDYDEMEDPSAYEHYEMIKKKPQENLWIERMKSRGRMVDGSNNSDFKGCPNKYNIFHKCSLFCVNRWGDGNPEPNREYLKRKQRLLRKYPLPKNWQEIYDNGCGSYYFWNCKDDTVSWLPPNHPKSQISKSAASLRRELEEIQPSTNEDEDDGNGTIIPGLTDKDLDEILNLPMHPPRRRADSPNNDSAQPMIKKQKNRDLDKVMRHKESRRNRDYHHRSDGRYNRKSGPGGGGKKDSDPLDPMDPASYSDIPRGKWSDGLNPEASKRGVDSTVTGTLFQMRPYPSPGAILQANANAKAKLSGSGKESGDNRGSDDGNDDER